MLLLELKYIKLLFGTWAIPDPMSPPPTTVTCFIADIADGEVEKHLFNMRTLCAILLKSC